MNATVFRCNDNRTIHGDGDIKQLGILHWALQRPQQLPSLAEHSYVDLLVVVSNKDLPGNGQANPNGKVCNTFPSNLPQIVPLVIKDLDAVVLLVVTDENFLLIIHCDTIREGEIGIAVS